MSAAGAPTRPRLGAGLMLWAVWLVFLAFPFAALLDTGHPLAVKAIGAALLLGFAVAYLWLARRLLPEGPDSYAELGFVVLLALTLALAPIIGIDAISLSPFLASYAAFGLRRPWCWWASAGLFAVVVALVLTSGDTSTWSWFLFVLFAVSVGTAVGRLMAHRGRLHAAEAQQHAVVVERARVARDVHDVLGHSLTVVALKAQLAERLIESDPERARAELIGVQELTREALAEIRATVGGLRATNLVDELERATAALDTAGVELDVLGDAEVVDPARRTVVAWALREAVTNVVRHSGARHCRIELGPESLTVDDDGAGVASEGREPGNGLRGLGERVHGAGGTLRLGPGTGGVGTRLEVTW